MSWRSASRKPAFRHAPKKWTTSPKKSSATRQVERTRAGLKRQVTTWTSALAVLGAWLYRVIPVVQVARPVGRGLGPASAAEAYGAPHGEKAIGRPLGDIALRVHGIWRGDLRVLVGRV